MKECVREPHDASAHDHVNREHDRREEASPALLLCFRSALLHHPLSLSHTPMGAHTYKYNTRTHPCSQKVHTDPLGVPGRRRNGLPQLPSLTEKPEQIRHSDSSLTNSLSHSPIAQSFSYTNHTNPSSDSYKRTCSPDAPSPWSSSSSSIFPETNPLKLYLCGESPGVLETPRSKNF